MVSLQRILIVFAGIAGTCFAIGCNSGPRNSVKGAVTFEGEIVDEGGIAFLPLANGGGTNRATGLIENGRYELSSISGPDTGKYRVEITWRKKTGKQTPGEGGVLKEERLQILPAKFNTESQLTVDVKPGRNTFDFHLKK